MSNHMIAAFYGVANYDDFCKTVQSALNQITSGGVFIGDNLFTFGRNLGFLEDDRLMTPFKANAETESEKAILWRNHVQCWAAQLCPSSCALTCTRSANGMRFETML